MKRRVFEGEIDELAGHVAELDRILAVLSERLGYLEKLRQRAVATQRLMQDFCDQLAAAETAAQAAELDAAATHEAPPLVN